jgi:hypothetical protein
MRGDCSAKLSRLCVSSTGLDRLREARRHEALDCTKQRKTACQQLVASSGDSDAPALRRMAGLSDVTMEGYVSASSPAIREALRRSG